MDRTERFYQIDQMLQSGRPVPIERFLDTLAVSRATFKRDLEYMRDRLNAPIEWDRFEGGYRYAEPAGGPAFALPGLWFNDREVLTHAGKLRMDVAQQLAADRFAVFDAARKQADAVQADTDDLAAIEALAKDLSRDRGKT